jgi:hypothetical protein
MGRSNIQDSRINSNHEPLDLILQRPDLIRKITHLIGRNTRRNNCTAHATSSSKSCFARYVDIWDVFIFAQQWKVEQDGERSGVGSQNDNLGDAAIEGLGSFVGALFELAVV